MKTKVFTFNTGGDFLILAFVRVIGSKSWVNYFYSNSLCSFTPDGYELMDLMPIKKWAKKNGAEWLFDEWADVTQINLLTD